MKYSILIPVYNTEQYLARAVESVEGQGIDDYEIVIVDDGSTDQSGEIARSLAERNDRIKLIRQENAYVGAARNRAVAEAKGDYLYFLDSDDVLLEGVLSRLMPLGEDVIASAIRFDTGETLESVSGEELFLFSPYLGQSFYKRELVQSAPAFSTERKTAEDCEWLFALLQRAQSFGLRAYPFYRYTVGREGSLCNAYRADRLAPTIRTWLKLFDSVESSAYPDKGKLRAYCADGLIQHLIRASFVRGKEKEELNALIASSVPYLRTKGCKLSAFLWLRHFIGMKGVLRLANIRMKLPVPIES